MNRVICLIKILSTSSTQTMNPSDYPRGNQACSGKSTYCNSDLYHCKIGILFFFDEHSLVFFSSGRCEYKELMFFLGDQIFTFSLEFGCQFCLLELMRGRLMGEGFFSWENVGFLVLICLILFLSRWSSSFLQIWYIKLFSVYLTFIWNNSYFR